MNKVWWARVETRSFDFDAFAPTEHEAREVLRRGWETHRRATGATLTWRELSCDVQAIEVTLGRCMRDREQI